jgi:hypothetical protein
VTTGPRHRLRAAAAVLGVACLVLAGCASTTKATSTTPSTMQALGVHAPPAVFPGAPMTITATGFRPGGSLSIVLAPADKQACCAVRIPKTVAPNEQGKATFSFKMPRSYRRCNAAGACKSVAWGAHEKVVITVGGYLEQARGTTVIGSRDE